MTLDVLNKNENIVNAGYWVLQSVLVAKISSRKTKKIANPQKQTPAKISCHTRYIWSGESAPDMLSTCIYLTVKPI